MILRKFSRADGTGRRGERIAARWLRRRGFRILDRNVRRGRYEIDILAMAPEGRTLVVVEVKSGRAGFERLAGKVDRTKRRRIAAVAADVMAGRTDVPIRFDVVLVQFEGDGRWRLRHLPSAFDHGD